MAALISTQLLPLVAWATRRGVSRGLAIAGSMIGVVVIVAGLAWVFSDSLFGNLGGIGKDISGVAGIGFRGKSRLPDMDVRAN